MKSVVVYYFSGTGNTEIVAEKIGEEFSRLEYKVELIRIEDVLKGERKADPRPFDLIGIGCPVIGYGVPQLVWNFIRNLPEENGKKTFVFRPAGGVAPANYNASKAMIGELARKGYEVFYERVFSIGSNWIVRFEDSVVRQLHEATCRKAALLCREVDRGDQRLLETGIGLKMRMGFARRAFSGMMRLVGKDLSIDKACSNCGRCIRNCPAGNIGRKNGKIRFGFSCNSCMRCVYSCPEAAVRFRLLTFFPVPGGYDIHKILSQPCTESGKVTKPAPPFFREYVGNDAM